MTDWQDVLIAPEISIRDALETINTTGHQIALIVDHNRMLRGVVTDGDVRRGLLRGLSLDDPVSEVMNSEPTTARQGEDRERLLFLMRRQRLHQVPIVDDDGRVVDLEVMDELLEPTKRENAAVLMAGGLGTRLRPLTEDVPKPLIPVGGKPMLETIVERLLDHGIRRLFFSVNYKAEMIEEHFGDGGRWGADITYLREEERLGTAGPLSLLPARPEEPFLVMNCDVLTKLDFSQLFEYHERHDSVATMCVRDYDVQVPYGVIRTEDERIVGIDEKPIQRFYVNAGIYVLDALTLEYVPDGQFFDMPDLFRRLQDDDHKTAVFPVREYWTDVGRMEDLERANEEYEGIFG